MSTSIPHGWYTDSTGISISTGTTFTSTYTDIYESPPTTLQQLIDYCNDRKLTEKDLEWLEYNVPFTINIYEQLQKIENKLDKPFSAVVKQKLRKMKLDRVKV